MLLTDRMGRSEEELAQAAQETGVKVYRMRDFRMEEKKEAAAMLILGYASLSPEEICEGVDLLKKAWL